MEEEIRFEEFMGFLLKGITSALDMDLVDFEPYVETLIWGVKPRERIREVLPFQDLEIPSRIFVIGKTAYQKRLMRFFIVFYVNISGVKLEAADVYDTENGIEIPKEGERRTIKALMIFLEVVRKAIQNIMKKRDDVERES